MKSKIAPKIMGRGLAVILAVVLAFIVAGSRPLTVSAEYSGTVTATSANVRSEPSSSGSVIASVVQGNTVDIKSQTTGTDGNIWYEIHVNANQIGYIRSDLVSTSGSIPTSEGGAATTETPQTAGGANTEGVSKVNPVSATVSGGASVRVRSDASTSNEILTNVERGQVVTVVGTKAGTDSHTWYLAEFSKNGNTMNGYIRDDFLTLAGELVPYTEEAEGTGEGETGEAPAEETAAPAEPVVTVTKRYETQLQGDAWFLLDNENSLQYDIESIFKDNEQNIRTIESQRKKLKTNRTVLVIFIVIAIGACALAAFCFMKWKELQDKGDFARAEKNNAARRSQRPAGPGRAPEGGAGRGTRPQGGRPQGGARPQGGRPAPGSRPAGARPQGERAEGEDRPARPQGNRPAGARPAGPRPEGRPESRPKREQPAEEPEMPHRVREHAPETAEPAQRTEEAPVRPPRMPQPEPGRRPSARPQSSSASDDDDEFDFDFLSWNDEDKK